MSDWLKNYIFGPKIQNIHDKALLQVHILNENKTKVIAEDITFQKLHQQDTRNSKVTMTEYSKIVGYHYLLSQFGGLDGVTLVNQNIIDELLKTTQKSVWYANVSGDVGNGPFKEFQDKLNNILVPLWTPGIYTTFKELRENSDSYINKFWKDTDDTLYSATTNNCGPWHNGLICIACGWKILQNDEKDCDHLIPVIQAFISIKAEFNCNEFNYLHRSCNKAKLNMSLLEFMAAVTQNQFYNQCMTGRTPLLDSRQLM